VRITAAQPLTPGPEGRQLAPTPLLSPAESEAEAAAFLADPAMYQLEPLEDFPPEWHGQPVERLLAAGELDWYTHRLYVMEAPEHVCRDYLVRVET
jgi:hypothetical protein